MKIITIILFLLVIALPASAKECTTMEAFAAESVIDYLDSWEKVYKSFKDFGHCDDAAIAEGYDDVISKLWADHWDKLSEMIKYTKENSEFKRFIYKRIGTETIPYDRWEKIVSLAKNQCPTNAYDFCKEILKSK
jgi:hypothetical protein